MPNTLTLYIVCLHDILSNVEPQIAYEYGFPMGRVPIDLSKYENTEDIGSCTSQIHFFICM